MEIKAGQYWLVEKGCVALVLGRNGDNSAWLVNRVDTQGELCADVGVVDSNFERQITAAETEEITVARARKRVIDFLRLS